MRIASSEFADDPCSSVKRGTMVRAARALLSAVTRLLILADMADVMRLLSHLKIVRMWNLAKPALWAWQYGLYIKTRNCTKDVSLLTRSHTHPSGISSNFSFF